MQEVDASRSYDGAMLAGDRDRERATAALQEHYPEPHDLVNEHRVLVDAISDGDEELLLSLIEAHMRDSIERLTPPAEALPHGG